MNLKEQFESETGLYCTKYDPETGNTNYSDEYVEWLEAKVQQSNTPEVNNCAACGSGRLFSLGPHNASCYDCDSITKTV